MFLAASSLKGRIFSKFTYRVRCVGEEDRIVEELIEPLASVLRDTRGVCAGFPQAYVGSKNFLLVGKSAFPGEDLILYDFGASLWSGDDGRQVSQKWFLEKYQNVGFTVRDMYMFEVSSHSDHDIYRGVPTHLLPAYHYYNVPISEKKGEPFHAWTFLRNSLLKRKTPSFVAVKLDIDAPHVELSLVKQLVASKGINGRVNEFFFEHHTAIPEMQRIGWNYNVQGTVADTYDLFIALRKNGIRAHAWP